MLDKLRQPLQDSRKLVQVIAYRVSAVAASDISSSTCVSRCKLPDWPCILNASAFLFLKKSKSCTSELLFVKLVEVFR
jgi:hypothetical protein